MAERSNIEPEAFDGQAAWATLPPHVQARIGAFALELGVAMGIMAHGGGPAQRAAEHAFDLSSELLQEAVLGYDGVSDRDWWNDHLSADGGTFSIPSCVGMVCRQCGCAHLDPCPEGCGWHTPGLCTACAAPEPDAGVEAAAVPDLSMDEVRANFGAACTKAVAELPDLPKEEARAIVKGACRAVAASPLAQPVQPLGGALRDLARAIDDMHAEIEGEAS